MPKNYLIRADASFSIGSGHVMRMIALGQMLQDEGQSVHFATIEENEDIIKRITAESFTLHRIKMGDGWEYSSDAEQLVDIAKQLDVEWIILDGYNFSALYQEIVKKRGWKLMCVDDVAQGHFFADLVVNQNINASLSLYSAEKYTKFMLGPKNALLRREYIKSKPDFKRKLASKIENVLITMGGADSANFTGRVCEALESLGYRINIKAVLGALNRNHEDILAYSRISKNRIEVFRNVGSEFPELMKWADIGIFASGGTIFEGLYLGLPLLCCQLAPNQKINYVEATKPEDVYKDILGAVRPLADFFLLKDIEVSSFDVRVILPGGHSNA